MLTLQTGQETQPVQREDQKESYPAISKQENRNSVALSLFSIKLSSICIFAQQRKTLTL